MTIAPNRQPAGSPDGGKFAPGAGGAEADVALIDPDTGLVPVPERAPNPEAQARIEALNAQSEAAAEALHAAQAAFVNSSLELSRALVENACPDATKVTWEWCGDGDLPGTLGTPTVTCPHVDPEWPECYEWDKAHGTEIADDFPILEEYDIRSYGPDHGIKGNSRGQYELDLTESVTAG